MDTDGATATLSTRKRENAICRGWYNRLGDRDSLLQAMGIIKEVPPPVD